MSIALKTDYYHPLLHTDDMAVLVSY